MPETGLAMFWFATAWMIKYLLYPFAFRYSYNYGSVHFTVLSSEHNFTVGL